MPNNMMIFVMGSLSTARLCGAACLAGTCKSSVENSAQSPSLLQQSTLHSAPSAQHVAANAVKDTQPEDGTAKQPVDVTAQQPVDVTAEQPESTNKMLMVDAEVEEYEIEDLLEARDPHVRSALIDRKHKLIMGWSARAACTATVNMFFASAGMYTAGEQQSFPWVHDYREARGRAIQPKTSEMANPEFLKFKITRNPYRRAVSNWVHQMETDFSYNEAYQQLAAENNVSQSSSFLEWLRFVKKVGFDKLDDHSKPQFSDWERAGGRYDKILQLESPDFDAQIAEINQNAKSELKFETMHVSSLLSIKTASSKQRHLFPRDETGRLLHPPAEELYENAVEQIALVKQIYGEDFDAYGYSREDVPVA